MVNFQAHYPVRYYVAHLNNTNSYSVLNGADGISILNWSLESVPIGVVRKSVPIVSIQNVGISTVIISQIDTDRLSAYVETRVSESVKAATAIDTDKVNVNGKPFYIGPVMVLSDQDVTALKHHVLSSAVMGTVFASLIATLSNPEIPLIWRACLLGGILTGLQGILVAVSNVGIVGFETWCKRGKPLPFRWCQRCFTRVCVSVWHAYVNGHTFTLANGVTVWVDGMTTVVLDAPEDQESAL